MEGHIKTGHGATVCHPAYQNTKLSAKAYPARIPYVLKDCF